MKRKVAQFISILLMLLVTGLFWGTWFAMTRSIEIFSAGEFIKIGKVIIENVATPMRIIFPGCLLFMILSIVLVPEKNSTRFYLMILAFMFMVIALLITLLAEVPIDNQLKNWTATTLPSDWETIRARWKFYHMLRTFSSVAGFGFFISACLKSDCIRFVIR